MMLTKDEINYELIDRADIVHFGTVSMTDEPSREATKAAVLYGKEHGKLISFDPNLRPPLGKVSMRQERKSHGDLSRRIL